jgi:hypothetical protein
MLTQMAKTGSTNYQSATSGTKTASSATTRNERPS